MPEQNQAPAEPGATGIPAPVGAQAAASSAQPAGASPADTAAATVEKLTKERDHWHGAALRARNQFLETDEGQRLQAAAVELEKLKAERKAADEKAAAEQGRYKELYDALKADVEKERAEAQARQQKLLQSRARDALDAAARQAGVSSMRLFHLLTQAAVSDGRVTVADDGSVSGVEDVLAEVRQAEPVLFGAQATTQPAPPTGSGPSTDPWKLERGAGIDAVSKAWNNIRGRHYGR